MSLLLPETNAAACFPRLLGILVLALNAIALSTRADQVVFLTWDPSPDPSVVGYHVYCRRLGNEELNTFTVAATNVCNITHLVEGETYSFYATAFDADGLESDPSNQVEYTAPGSNAPPLVGAGANQSITLPASVQLSGTASDDGLPNPPGQMSFNTTYYWRVKVVGPYFPVYSAVWSFQP